MLVQVVATGVVRLFSIALLVAVAGIGSAASSEPASPAQSPPAATSRLVVLNGDAMTIADIVDITEGRATIGGIGLGYAEDPVGPRRPAVWARAVEASQLVGEGGQVLDADQTICRSAMAPAAASVMPKTSFSMAAS
jgi:hypothetical protein